MNADKASYKKSSFSPAFLFLDKHRREGLAIYYAFCRLMDDLADEPGVQDRVKELTFWQEEVQRAFDGQAQTDLGKDIAQIAREFAMGPDRFLLLIEGMLADVQGRSYKNFEDLEWYLWRVAGIVGLATLDILGLKGHKAEELARAQGFAVQTTNIVRDVHDDAQMGRVYLPEDLLCEHGLTREDVLKNTNPAQLAKALEDLAAKSRSFYAQTQELTKAFPSRKTLPCRVMGLVYLANLAKIEKTDFKFDQTVRLSKVQKILQCIYAICTTDLAD